MRDMVPPFKFNISKILKKANRLLKNRVDGVTINFPFLSVNVNPENIENKVSKEIVIRLADKRVLNAFECCDNCIEQALSSLHGIRVLLVNKQVDLSDQVNGPLYILLELMLEGIRRFFTFEEGLRSSNIQYPGKLHSRHQREDLKPYFAALEMLRTHLFRCLTQVSVIADIEIPKISANMRYDQAWQLEAYEHLQLNEG